MYYRIYDSIFYYMIFVTTKYFYFNLILILIIFLNLLIILVISPPHTILFTFCSYTKIIIAIILSGVRQFSLSFAAPHARSPRFIVAYLYIAPFGAN